MSEVRRGLLSQLFDGIAAKKLTLVETVSDHSNQHEFQGVAPLRKLFGDDDRRGIPTQFIWLAEEQDALSEEGFISWSNVRKGKPRTAEYHLYYSGNAVTEAMKLGDTVFIALRSGGSAMVIVAPADSTMQRQLIWLFGLPEQFTFGFEYRDVAHDGSAELDFAARYILDELGLDFEEPEADRLDNLLDNFGMKFPTTRVFSDLARSSLKHVNPLDDPDKVLMAWVEQEELLFRRLERRVVSERLRSGFMTTAVDADVDGFLRFSLSVQNRRKSRAGLGLENHLEELFKVHNIRFDRGAQIESRNKPDFLFPGASEYRDNQFPADRLTILGVKTTSKDRWRQVLSEAKRIEVKHLATLEPGISENQTDEMRDKALRLVVPVAIQPTYRESQRAWLLSVREFLTLVKARDWMGIT